MSNEILEELWKIREGIARECGYDGKRLRQRLEKLKASLPRERVVTLQNGKSWQRIEPVDVK